MRLRAVDTLPQGRREANGPPPLSWAAGATRGAPDPEYELDSPDEVLIEERAREMLIEAYELLLAGWAQGAPARDEYGRPTEPASALARTWSAAGALERVWQRSGLHPDDSLESYARANLGLTAVVHRDLDEWNDAEDRKVSEVLDAFAEAAEVVRLAARREKLG